MTQVKIMGAKGRETETGSREYTRGRRDYQNTTGNTSVPDSVLPLKLLLPLFSWATPGWDQVRHSVALPCAGRVNRMEDQTTNGSPRLTCFHWQTLTIGLQLTFIQQSPLNSRPLIFVWSDVSPHSWGRMLKGLRLRGVVMPGLFQIHSISDFKQLWNWHDTNPFCETNSPETSGFKNDRLSIDGLEFLCWVCQSFLVFDWHY